MTDAIDLAAERERRSLSKAIRSAVHVTIGADDMPLPQPVAAPGYTVVVLDPSGAEAFRMPCETGASDGEDVFGVWPGTEERPIVGAALREAEAIIRGSLSAAE